MKKKKLKPVPEKPSSPAFFYMVCYTYIKNNGDFGYARSTLAAEGEVDLAQAIMCLERESEPGCIVCVSSCLPIAKSSYEAFAHHTMLHMQSDAPRTGAGV